MELEIRDRVIKQPTATDISAAIGAGDLPDDWYLTLTEDGDDFMEARPAGTRFTLEYSEGAERRKAADSVDAATAEAVLTAYLKGESSWRTRVRWAGSAGSKPPGAGAPLSAIAVAVVIVAVGALVWFRPALTVPPPLDDWRAWPVLLIFLAIPGLVLFAAIKKTLEVRRASGWATTNARITKSTIAAEHSRRINATEQLTNMPIVEYEFVTAEGSHVRGRRISIGDDVAVNADAVLSKYPVGASVPVFYNPDRPAECVLERDPPVNMPRMLAVVVVVVFGGLPLAYFAMTAIYRALDARLTHGNPLLVMFCAAAGVIVGANGIRARREAAAASNWPTTSGRVVSSGAERYTSVHLSKTQDATFEPVVEYAFAVHGREFRSRRIDFGAHVGTQRAAAERRAAAYPVGMQVQVQYDPQNPSEAVLHVGSNPVLPLVAAVALFLVAVYFSGVFGA
jgi:hypothetical protein